MLILCCGPDSYRAVARAQDLESAFRQKHDPSGTSVERFESGKGAVEEVIERSLTVSLFSPMRFLRADGLIQHCPKTKTKALANALSKDPERVIVVSIEQEKPTAIDLKPFADVPKLIVNDYPLLSQKEFRAWVLQTGLAMGVSDEKTLEKLADACQSDAWLASQELTKMAAGGTSEIIRAEEIDAYAASDAFLRRDGRRYDVLKNKDAVSSFMYPLSQQNISALRVRDRDTANLSPFVVNKIQRMNISETENLMSHVLMIQYLQRLGFADDQEALSLLP